MTIVKYSPEMWVLWKIEEIVEDVIQRSSQNIVLGMIHNYSI